MTKREIQPAQKYYPPDDDTRYWVYTSNDQPPLFAHVAITSESEELTIVEASGPHTADALAAIFDDPHADWSAADTSNEAHAVAGSFNASFEAEVPGTYPGGHEQLAHNAAAYILAAGAEIEITE